MARLAGHLRVTQIGPEISLSFQMQLDHIVITGRYVLTDF